MELIKIDNEGKITARELYEFLELTAGSFIRWAKTNIEGDDFYSENVDWQGFSIVLNGNETKDYKLTIDFAKHLCMLSRSAKGKQARAYFVEAEKRALTPVLPQTYKEALVALLSSVEDNERLTAVNAIMAPKAEFYDTVTQSETMMDFQAVAAILAVKGYGRNNLIKFLVAKGVLVNSQTPYRKHVDNGNFKVVENSYVNSKTESVVVSKKVVVSQKGIDYIGKLLKKAVA